MSFEEVSGGGRVRGSVDFKVWQVGGWRWEVDIQDMMDG